MKYYEQSFFTGDNNGFSKKKLKDLGLKLKESIFIFIRKMKMTIYLLLILNLALLGCLCLNKRKEVEPVLKLSENEPFNNNIIELESDFIITQIKWTKHEDYDLNYLLGIFEGANDPSFSDAVPLAMIKEQGKFNEVNFIDVITPYTYKYVRYIPPNKNLSDISPIKIIGHKINEGSDDYSVKKVF